MEKLVVLVFIDWFYPAYKAGGPITSCLNLIDNLKAYYTFKIVTGDTDYLETAPYVENSDVWKVKNGYEVIYLSKKNIGIKGMNKIIKGTSYDILWINGMFSFWYSIVPLLNRNKNGRTVVSVRGMLGSNVLKFKPIKKIFFLGLSQLFRFHKNVIFHVTNKSERDDVNSIFGANEIFIAENFPNASGLVNPTQYKKVEGRFRILQVARVAKEKNILFSIKILEACDFNVELDIVGSIYDQDYYQKCKQECSNLPSNIKVNFIGALKPDEIRGLYSKYDVFLSPTLGENYGHAIFESLINGLPVIISNKTMWDDLSQNKAGYDLELEEQGFLNAIKYLYSLNESEIKVWRVNSQKYAVKRINLTEIKKEYKQLFRIESSK